MTRRLFDENVYLMETQARVEAVEEKDGKVWVILDQTIFAPEGGGQDADHGWINGIAVLDVREKGESIHHLVEKELLVGTEVDLKIDWDRRLDHMQQHCGEHILSGVIYEKLKGNNKGFHMGAEVVTVDIDLPAISDAMVLEIEAEVNRKIQENLPIEIQVVDRLEELADVPLRKMPTVDTDIRVVNVPGVDCVACCGTHPTQTGEVGILRILRADKYKGMTRIQFVCGMRAVKNSTFEHHILRELNQQYSTESAGLVARLTKEREKISKLEQELKVYQVQEMDLLAAELIAEKQIILSREFESMESGMMMNLAKTILKERQGICLFASLSEKKVILVHNVKELHAGKVFKETIQAANGRGGGGASSAQGSFQNLEDLQSFLASIQTLLGR
ncbi:alanyl-tRNA editing protein [Gottschalkiaceae bacterium SANA]|nr:alanyl-tRNA editing protein [Gottschalkiaceae bacterium SANA]